MHLMHGDAGISGRGQTLSLAHVLDWELCHMVISLPIYFTFNSSAKKMIEEQSLKKEDIISETYLSSFFRKTPAYG